MKAIEAIKIIKGLIASVELVYKTSPLTDKEQHHATDALTLAISALEQDEWIPVTERLPEEREWIGTKHFGTTISDEVYVTFEAPSGERFARHISFQNGRLSSHDQRVMDTVFEGAKPIAWRPHPEPYKGDL